MRACGWGFVGVAVGGFFCLMFHCAGEFELALLGVLGAGSLVFFLIVRVSAIFFATYFGVVGDTRICGSLCLRFRYQSV